MQEPHNLKLYHSRWNSVCGRISLFTSANRNWHRVRLLVKFLSERLFKTPVLLCWILWTVSRQNCKQTNCGPFRECVEPSALDAQSPWHFPFFSPARVPGLMPNPLLRLARRFCKHFSYRTSCKWQSADRPTGGQHMATQHCLNDATITKSMTK